MFICYLWLNCMCGVFILQLFICRLIYTCLQLCSSASVFAYLSFRKSLPACFSVCSWVQVHKSIYTLNSCNFTCTFVLFSFLFCQFVFVLDIIIWQGSYVLLFLTNCSWKVNLKEIQTSHKLQTWATMIQIGLIIKAAFRWNQAFACISSHQDTPTRTI